MLFPKHIVIRVANPEALGGKTHTSGKRALKLIHHKWAVLQEDGSLFVHPGYGQLPSFMQEYKCTTGLQWYVGISGNYTVLMAESI